MNRAEVLKKIRERLEEPEEIYLVNHYRRGDTGVPSFIAGAVMVLLDEEELPTISELKALAHQVLDEMVADPNIVARLDAMENRATEFVNQAKRNGARIE